MNQLKICIIIAYFGKLPNYFVLWLKSCQYNPTVDFLVCSDISAPQLPSNVRWIEKSFLDFKKQVENKLQMKVQLDTPYECCDFKAVYGTIFEDELRGYDYWGYCDMDMVFGDLAWFFKQHHLEWYDKFQNVGHLTLMRNTPENNARYKLPCTHGKGYKDAFVTKGSTHFCEGEINEIYRAYSFPFFDKRVHADICPSNHRMKISPESPVYPCNHKYQTFYWQNGKVWRAYIKNNHIWRGVFLEEFAYIHFQKRKMTNIDFNVDNTHAFYICKDHFEAKKELQTPSYGEIYRTNPYSVLGEGLDFLCAQFNRIKRKIDFLLEKHKHGKKGTK